MPIQPGHQEDLDLDRRVLVFDGLKLAGILSPSDVARIVSVRQAMASHLPVLRADQAGYERLKGALRPS